MVKYVSTPTATTANARVYEGEHSHLEAVEVPDMASLIDTAEDRLAEAVSAGIPLREIALNLIQTTRLELLSELLLKLLLLFKDSDNVKLDSAILISAAGLPLESKSDTALAKEHGILKQTLSARKMALLKRLGLPTPAHGKSDAAKKTYALTNQSNFKLEE